MIIRTRLISKGRNAFTFYPFILVRPTSASDLALLGREMIHYREQQDLGVIQWFWRYCTDEDFRLGAELRAYAEQVRLGGITTWEAAKLLSTYDTGHSPEELNKLLVLQVGRATVTPDLYTLVGELGRSRIELFRQVQAGWDHGKGEPLRLESLRKANEYAQGMRYCMDVSVYMSTEGNLVLNWHDPVSTRKGDGRVVEVEFGDVVSVFIENTGQEFRVLSGDPRIPIPPGAK